MSEQRDAKEPCPFCGKPFYVGNKWTCGTVRHDYQFPTHDQSDNCIIRERDNLKAEAERLRGENERLESELAELKVVDCPYCDGSGEVCESCLQAAADCECEATGKVMCVECEGSGKDQEI